MAQRVRTSDTSDRMSDRLRKHLRVGAMVVLSLSTSIATSCNPSDPPGDGYLLVQVASPSLAGTPLADLGPITVHSTRLDVVHRSDCSDPSTEHVLTISNTPGSFTLNAGALNAPVLVNAQAPVPAGCILQIRFITDAMQAVLSNVATNVKVPSGTQTGIKIVPTDEQSPFTVTAGQTTLVRVTYDPNSSLVINKGQGVLEKPVLQGTQVDSDLAIGVVLDEVVLTFDKGTSQADILNVVNSAGDTIRRQWPQEYVTVKLPATNMLRSRIQYYLQQSHVKVALPNTLLDLQGLNPFSGSPSDPLLLDTAPTGFELLNLQAIGVAPDASRSSAGAWTTTTGATITTSSTSAASFVAGIVDNGFDVLHADLMPNIWINQDELPLSQLTDVDNDGVITWTDLNDPANAAFCNKSLRPPNNVCDPLELLVTPSVADGKDGPPDDPNNPAKQDGLPDDLFGWDFNADGMGDNLPEPSALCTTSPCPSGTSTFPGHGTATSGNFVSVGNNGAAGAGVAWQARLMLLKGEIYVSGNTIKRDSFVRGLVFAHTHGAVVINTSLGSTLYREDVPAPGGCNRGVQGIPAAKFTSGVQGLSDEWQQMLGNLRPNSLLTVAANDCGENEDANGVFFYPGGFTISRPDISTTLFVDSTMITVDSADAWNPGANGGNGGPFTYPLLTASTFSAIAPKTVLVAATGALWRVNAAQAYPPTGVNVTTTNCGDNALRCSGNSLAAPLVAGGALLTLATHPSASPATVKSLLLTNATHDPNLDGVVENGRLLNIQAAVTAP